MENILQPLNNLGKKNFLCSVFCQNKRKKSMGKWQETNWPLTSTQMHQIFKKTKKKPFNEMLCISITPSLLPTSLTIFHEVFFPFHYVKEKFNFVFISSFFISNFPSFLFWIPQEMLSKFITSLNENLWLCLLYNWPHKVEF